MQHRVEGIQVFLKRAPAPKDCEHLLGGIVELHNALIELLFSGVADCTNWIRTSLCVCACEQTRITAHACEAGPGAAGRRWCGLCCPLLARPGAAPRGTGARRLLVTSWFFLFIVTFPLLPFPSYNFNQIIYLSIKFNPFPCSFLSPWYILLTNYMRDKLVFILL